MGLQERFIEYLQANVDQQFTAKEIATWVYEHYRAECEAKRANSKDGRLDSEEALLAQIAAEVGNAWRGAQKKDSKFKRTEKTPKKYYYSTLSDLEELGVEGELPIACIPAIDIRLERDLYPLLTEYLMMEFGIYSKRIDEKRSINSMGRGGNKWLFPDLVGMENLSSGWVQVVKDCAQESGGRKAKLWSFEVKRIINSGNVREVFFQAVSNSSWANFGYLVVGEPIQSNVMDELRILSGLHGIGLIQLEPDAPAESTIMIPARENPNIDWDTVNRIAAENSDFRNVIGELLKFYQTKGAMYEAFWDTGRVAMAVE